MKILKHCAALLACAAALSACGGGGGGGNGGGGANNGGSAGTPSGDQSWLSFTPNPITVQSQQGQSTAFTINARSSKTITQVFNIGIVEPDGLVTTQVEVKPVSQYEYNATLFISPLLAAGTRSGQLEVRLCEDDPLVCRKPINGSPWHLPLTVIVKAADTPPVTTPPVETPKPPAPVGMLFDNYSFALNTAQGEPFSFALNAIASRALFGEAQVGLYEKKGLLSSGTGVIGPGGGNSYRASLQTNGSLPVGKYSSSIEVRVCQDDPAICTKPVSGSPWSLPLTLEVSPLINLKALSALPGVPGWSTHQGNAAHSGAIVAEFDPANFSRRFNLPAAGQYSNGVAIDGNTIFSLTNNGQWTVQAISEDTGKPVWTQVLGALAHVNPPAAANGKVYLTSTGHEDSYLWILDQRNGNLLAKQAMSSQWDNYLAPTLYNGAVYSDYGSYGGMAKYDGSSAVPQWQVSLSQFDGWTPALDSQYAYTYLGGSFYALNNATGSVAYSVADPKYNWHGWSADGSVVLGNNMLYAYDGGRLSALNLASRTIAWSIQGNVSGQPALGATAIYVLNANGTTLEARDPVSGATQWIAGLDGSYRQVIVTSNLAFVSNDSATLAIDLDTHKTVWRYPQGGALAISSSGVLYIVSAQKLSAINLQ